jgi:ABC-type uncharacterized transport system substrate-binding protein
MRIMPFSSLRLVCGTLAVVAGVSGLCAPAAAHPHVWVTVETTIVYDKGTVTGLKQKWSFDEMYTAMAIQGLDTNNDGAFDRKELEELAKVNIDGLKEFDYFTYGQLAKKPLKFKPPTEYYLEHVKDGALSLHFVLPLEQPVLAEAKGLTFAVYDPSFFIAFEMAKQNPVLLSEGAPKGCSARLAAPEKDVDTQKLGEAFFNSLGGASFGMSVSRSIEVDCTP